MTGKPTSCYRKIRKPVRFCGGISMQSDITRFGDYLVDYIHKHQDWAYSQTGVSGTLQPAYFGQDYSVCWLEEEDHKTGNLFDNLFDMQNSIYSRWGDWWNGARTGHDDISQEPDGDAYLYQGWNEVCFDSGIDKDTNQPKIKALVVVLPIEFDTLCDYSHAEVQQVDTLLHKYWKDGYGTNPVVIMKTYDNGNKNYKKYTFSQSFKFKSGNCIAKGGPGCLGDFCYIAGDDAAHYC